MLSGLMSQWAWNLNYYFSFSLTWVLNAILSSLFGQSNRIEKSNLFECNLGPLITKIANNSVYIPAVRRWRHCQGLHRTYGSRRQASPTESHLPTPAPPPYARPKINMHTIHTCFTVKMYSYILSYHIQAYRKIYNLAGIFCKRA